MGIVRYHSSTSKLIFSLVILFVMTGCFKPRLPDVPINDISKYKTYQNRDGINVAIDVFSDRKKQLEYFGADLYPYDILPINFIIENNSNNTLLIEKKNIVLVNLGENSIHSVAVTGAKGSIDSKEKPLELVYTFTGIISPLTLAVFSPYLVDRTLSAETAKEYISRRALGDKIIYGGESNQGFLFYPLKYIPDKQEIITLQAKIKVVMTEETHTFNFSIYINEIKRQE